MTKAYNKCTTLFLIKTWSWLATVHITGVLVSVIWTTPYVKQQTPNNRRKTTDEKQQTLALSMENNVTSNTC